MDDDAAQQAQHHEAELARLERSVVALRNCVKAGVSEDDVRTLCFEASVDPALVFTK
jgi:hypothetical protein